MATQVCACGFLGDYRRPCACSPRQVKAYRARVSGPLLDRIDIHVEVPPLRFDTLMETREAPGTTEVRGRILAARERQAARQGAACPNACLAPREVERHCRIDARGTRLLRAALERLGLSARGVHRVLRVARTIADLEGGGAIAEAHLAEAIQYRSLDREVS